MNEQSRKVNIEMIPQVANIDDLDQFLANIDASYLPSFDQPNFYMIQGITMPGYDVLDAIRDDSAWSKMKAAIISLGKMSLEQAMPLVVAEGAKYIIK